MVDAPFILEHRASGFTFIVIYILFVHFPTSSEWITLRTQGNKALMHSLDISIHSLVMVFILIWALSLVDSFFFGTVKN